MKTNTTNMMQRQPSVSFLIDLKDTESGRTASTSNMTQRQSSHSFLMDSQDIESGRTASTSNMTQRQSSHSFLMDSKDLESDFRKTLKKKTKHKHRVISTGIKKIKRKVKRQSTNSFLIDSKEIESGMRKTLKQKTKQKNRAAIIRKGHKRSCLQSKRWFFYFFWTFLALLIQIICTSVIGESAFPDGRPACGGNNDGYNDDVLTVMSRRNKKMCGLAKTLERNVQNFNFLAAFIIGGFILASVKLWLGRRKAYFALCRATRNLLILIAAIVEDDDQRALLIRWTVLGYELGVMNGRALMDTKTTRDYLDSLHLLCSNEWEVMVDGDRHTSVWYWILKRSKMLRTPSSFTDDIDLSSTITDLEFQTICNAVCLARDKSNDILSIVGQDHPPPYLFVCALLININLIIHTMDAGIRWSIMSFDAGGGFMIWKELRMYVEVLLLYAFTSIFAALFDVTTILYNPFGPRKIDIPHYEFGASIRNFAMSLRENTDFESMKFNHLCEQQNNFSTMNLLNEESLQELDLELGIQVQQSEYGLLKKILPFGMKRKHT